MKKRILLIMLFGVLVSTVNSFAVTSYFNEAFNKSYESGMQYGRESLANEQRVYAGMTAEQKAFFTRIQTLYFKTVDEVNGRLYNARNACGAGNFYMFTYDPVRMNSANMCVQERCPWLQDQNVIDRIAKKVGAQTLREKKYVNFLFQYWQVFPVNNPDPPKAAYIYGYMNLK